MAIKPLNSVAGFSVGETPITVVDSIANVYANNLFVEGTSNLNNISNVKIFGGTGNQVIQTDGTGNLTFVTIEAWRIQNGTSNVSIAQANGNVTVSVDGHTNVATFTSTGANIDGYLTVDGDTTVNGNLIANNYIVTPITQDLFIAPQTEYTNFFSDVNPAADQTYQLGNTDVRWLNLYTNDANVLANLTAGNIATPGRITATGNITGGNITATGNVSAVTFLGNLEGNVSGNLSAPGSNTSLLFNKAGNIGASNAFKLDYAANIVTLTGKLTVTGNADVGNLDVIGVYAQTLSASGNADVGGILTDNYYYANGAPVDFQQPAGSNSQIQYNKNDDFGASANFTFNDTTNNLFVNANVLLGANSQNQIVPLSNTALEIRGGWNNATSATVSLVAGDYANGTNWGKLTWYGNLVGNATGQFEANIINFQPAGGGANIIKVNTLNYNATSTTTGALEIAGGAGITGNLYVGGLFSTTGNVEGGNLSIIGNANIGNIGTGGLITATGNITGGNLLTPGNISAGGGAQFGSLTVSNLTATGNISGGNLLTGGIVSAAGNGTFGNLISNTLTGANLTLTSTSGNLNFTVTSGNVVLNSVNIKNVADPVTAQDAATKYYVDNMVAAGIEVHSAVQADADSNKVGTYANGGTTPTWTTIVNGDTLVTAAPHGLALNDVIVFGVTTNGITAGTVYLVAAIPTANTIKLTTTWDGEPLALTNGTGLSITSLANSGVGATLTSTTNGPFTAEGYTAVLNDRILLLGQTNAYENGVYVITQVGVVDPGGSPWVLTRASDANKYAKFTATGLGPGAYFFVAGGSDRGESYVCNTSDVIAFGTTNISFAEFSIVIPYTAGTGLGLYPNNEFYISNTAVVAGSYGNGDRIATFTVNGQGQITAAANTAVQANAANLSGDTLASGVVKSSLTSVGTLANLSVAGNANVGNLNSSNVVSAIGNVIGGNLSTGGIITSVGTATVGNLITGGFISATGDANVGNLLTPGLISAVGNITGGNLTTGGQLTAIGNATVGNLITVGEISATGNATAGNVLTLGTISAGGNVTGGNLITAGFANVGTNLRIGNSTVNTTITWNSVTTTSVSANQTIASFQVTGITGVEYLVKGVDGTGSKYSVATVQAVTDGIGNVDYATFGSVQIGGLTGNLAVNVVGGYIRLQVTPASSNSTVWTTQYRLI